MKAEMSLNEQPACSRVKTVAFFRSGFFSKSFFFWSFKISSVLIITTFPWAMSVNESYHIPDLPENPIIKVVIMLLPSE
jgi:hypothetical protein